MNDRRLQIWSSRIRHRLPAVRALWRHVAARVLARHAHDPRVVPLLLELADSPARGPARVALAVLETLEGEEARDELCEAAIREPSGLAARIARERGWEPRDASRRSLYLFVTLQLDAYFEEDDGFHHLRPLFESADDALRRRLLAILRSGDRRCLAFFSGKKALEDCSDREIEFALKSFLKHEDWPRLFQAFLELPLRFGLRILHDLGRVDWQPDDPELASLHAQALREARGWLPPRAEQLLPPGETWSALLEAGEDESLASLGVDELLERLDSVPPLEAVSVVKALARRSSPGSEAARRVRGHPHWPVRLAGRVTGLGHDLSVDTLRDPVVWASRLAAPHPVLEIRPRIATPELLDELERGSERDPALEPARRVLSLLMGHRMTAGTFESLEVTVGEFDGEFDFVDEAELAGLSEIPRPGEASP